MCMVDNAEGGTAFPSQERRARKAHRCDECRRTIEPGEVYSYAVGVWDNGLEQNKCCAQCANAREWLREVCGGWLYDAVLEDLEEHWTDSPEYRSRWLIRAIRGMRNKWRRPNGAPIVLAPFTPACVPAVA